MYLYAFRERLQMTEYLKFDIMYGVMCKYHFTYSLFSVFLHLTSLDSLFCFSTNTKYIPILFSIPKVH